MARSSLSLYVTFFLLLLVTIIRPIASTNSLSYSIHHRRPLVLPLSLHPSNSSLSLVRRRLHNTIPHSNPTARMRLYDDLLSNGYYTTRLYIGTPPQEFALIVDTGSTVTYVPCSNCEQCGKHQDPRFQPELSSTYKPVKCNPSCYCDKEGKQCVYQRRYAEMSTSSGLLGNDVISFGNESELLPQHAVFGCETVETGDIYRQRADGIMGLGSGHLSIINQLVEKGVIDNSFSLCYGGMDIGGGAMILGGFPSPPGMVFSHSDPHRSPYYNFELKKIQVAGKPLRISPNTFNGGHGTVLDSGTTYAYLPAKAFDTFKAAIIKNTHSLRQIQGPDPNYHDICFGGAGWDISQLSTVFPPVDMVFSNGQKLSLSPENYLFKHTKVPGAYCLGIFKNENDETTLLGGILVRNILVTYDREKHKIGFWKTNCSELGKILHNNGRPATAPAPASLVSQSNNSDFMPPNLAPSGVPSEAFPADSEINVKSITFDMSFIFDDANMKPNFTELAEAIAHELDISSSEVRFLNYTSRGNQFVVKWAIVPAKSANYISTSTAMSIILHLRNHSMQLPDKFSSYQLVELKIEPQKKLTWWQQHVAVVVATAGVMLLSLSIIGVWFVWRKKQQALIAYKPVDAVVPEQELQPL